ncbi:MAG: hypothetical protein WA364_16020 [Candidatus Nitrosopolaris sp.]
MNIKLRLALLYLQSTKDGHCTDFVTLILEKVWYTSKNAKSITLPCCRYFTHCTNDKSSVSDEAAISFFSSCRTFFSSLIQHEIKVISLQSAAVDDVVVVVVVVVSFI